MAVIVHMVGDVLFDDILVPHGRVTDTGVIEPPGSHQPDDQVVRVAAAEENNNTRSSIHAALLTCHSLLELHPGLIQIAWDTQSWGDWF